MSDEPNRSLATEYHRRALRRIAAALAWAVAGASLVVAGAPPAHSAPGDFDPKFNEYAHDGTATAIAVDEQRRIVTAGYSRRGDGLAVARYNENGGPDVSFGGNRDGLAIAELPQSYGAEDVALQSDGKIVAVGGADYDWAIAVVRLLPNGSPDPDFNGGRPIVDYPLVGGHTAKAVAVDALGRIVVAGTTTKVGISQDVVIVRYLGDGSRDRTFGIGGVVVRDLAGASRDFVGSVAIGSDGDIVVAATARSYDQVVLVSDPYGPDGNDDDIAVARYTELGTPDTTFGDGGVVVTRSAGRDAGMDLVLLPDGDTIVVGGPSQPGDRSRIEPPPAGARTVLVRYEPNGTLDETFGNAGTASVPLEEDQASNSEGTWVYGWANGIILGATGDRLVVIGETQTIHFDAVPVRWSRTSVLRRFNMDGSLDASFAAGGTAVRNSRLGQAIALQGENAVAVEKEPWTFGSVRDRLSRYQLAPDAPTELNLSVPATAQHSDGVAIGITLTSAGVPLPNRTVYVALAGTVTQIVTDSLGRAKAVLGATLTPGNYSIKVSFPAEWGGYAGAFESRTVEVVREVTSLSYVGELRARGSSVTLAAVLTEDDGPTVHGATVVFEVAGQFLEAITDSAGIATVSATIPDHGRSQTVSVRYAGSPVHDPSSITETITWGAG